MHIFGCQTGWTVDDNRSPTIEVKKSNYCQFIHYGAKFWTSMYEN